MALHLLVKQGHLGSRGRSASKILRPRQSARLLQPISDAALRDFWGLISLFGSASEYDSSFLEGLRWGANMDVEPGSEGGAGVAAAPLGQRCDEPLPAGPANSPASAAEGFVGCGLSSLCGAMEVDGASAAVGPGVRSATLPPFDAAGELPIAVPGVSSELPDGPPPVRFVAPACALLRALPDAVTALQWQPWRSHTLWVPTAAVGSEGAPRSGAQVGRSL